LQNEDEVCQVKKSGDVKMKSESVVLYLSRNILKILAITAW
jgi:hypothetical protein